MNKVLVTGLALGFDSGLCSACNFDFDWLLNYPSILLWVDKIYIAQKIWDVVQSGNVPNTNDYPELNKGLKLIFEMLKNEGLIEIFKPTVILDRNLVQRITKQIKIDRSELVTAFPKHITQGKDNKVPGQIIIDGEEYCSPDLYTTYASLIVAKSLNAQCLFNDHTYNYLKYKFGLNSRSSQIKSGNVETFQNVFSAYLPNEIVVSGPMSKKCLDCNNLESCRQKYLSLVEADFKRILKWRDYDEIQQLKGVVDKIIKKRGSSGGIIEAAGEAASASNRDSVGEQEVGVGVASF